MKITQKIIDDLEKALDMRKKNGDEVWEDGDDIEVQIAGTFAKDRFIVLKNVSNSMILLILAVFLSALLTRPHP